MSSNNIYLIGFMGVGKTSLGKKLAREMGYRFVDLDYLFERKYKVRIDDFFGKYDEKLFRKLEHELLVKSFSYRKTIIATGGGTPCFYKSMEKINQNGLSIYLEMAPKAIAHRLTHAKKPRPLIKGKSGDELLKAIEQKLIDRICYYSQASLTVNVLHTSAKQLAAILTKQHNSKDTPDLLFEQ